MRNLNKLGLTGLLTFISAMNCGFIQYNNNTFRLNLFEKQKLNLEECVTSQIEGKLPYTIHILPQIHQDQLRGEIDLQGILSQLRKVNILNYLIKQNKISTVVLESFPQNINLKDYDNNESEYNYFKGCKKSYGNNNHNNEAEDICNTLTIKTFLSLAPHYSILSIENPNIKFTGFEEGSYEENYELLIKIARGDKEAWKKVGIERSKIATDYILGLSNKGNKALVIGAAHLPEIKDYLMTIPIEDRPEIRLYKECEGALFATEELIESTVKEFDEEKYHKWRIQKYLSNPQDN